MKKIALAAALFLFSFCLQAQELETPIQYMNYISTQHTNISKIYMSYASASGHGKRAKKVETLRMKLLDEIQEARMNISGMPAFKGDKGFRDSSVAFLKLYFNILNDDYAKVINMEDIAERSYDEMEAYLLIKEEIDKKLEEGNKKIQLAEKEFATKNNINMVAASSDLSQKLNQVHELNDYYSDIYLIFFKPYVQEQKINEFIEKKNTTGLEQTNNAMRKYAEEGIEKLKATKAFQSDASVANACKQMLNFFIWESDQNKKISEYFLIRQNFEKMAKDFEKKDEPTKAEIDAYNKGVNEINKASNDFNERIKNLNSRSRDEFKTWNDAVNSFFNEHTPRY
jgi:hypothetical protein